MNARLPETSSIPERIAHLRGAMAREGLAAYLVPSADPHLSEYLPGRWQGRQWLSGFTGSPIWSYVAGYPGPPPSLVASPCFKAFLLPRGAPDPGAPPCIRQRFFPLTAGDWQRLPDLVLAPQRALDSIGPVLRG